jgi:cysteine desulfurase
MIYADNAATTKMSDSVFEKMLPFLREQYGNASSQYSLGITARRAVEQARKQVAVAVGATPSEIIFTSSGSEANDWALRGVTDIHRGGPVHIITSSIEHRSVLNACRALESVGVEVTFLPVDYTGRVSVEDVIAAIKPHTKLVSIMLANNEIGTIQPIEQIGQLLKERGILFHTDAVQAVGHIPVDVNNLQVDFLTASAHKFNGAKGTGILYNRSGLGLPPPVLGGEPDGRSHAGTENVAGIVAAGFAIEESVREMGECAKRLMAMVDATVEGIKERIPTMIVNGAPAERLPGLVNLGFDGVSGESLMHLLDLKGICVSTGSACTSGSGEPSHVLLALGLSPRQAKSAIRVSYGRYNRLQEAGKVVSAICDAYGKIVGVKTYIF